MIVLLFCITLLTASSNIFSQTVRNPAIIWSDEFNGKSIDTTKWSYRDLGPRRDAINVKEAVSLDGKGNLIIKTYKKGEKYLTGMIGTQGKFEHTFGYWECRMRFQKQIGHWSAFWLQSPNYGKTIGDVQTSGAEIDIIEYLVHEKNLLRHNVHWDGYKQHHKSHGKRRKYSGLDKGFHLIGLEWTKKEYIFYVDGKETWRTNKGVSNRPQYIILSLEVGKWADDISKASLPDSMIVDYMRVYKRKP